MNPPAHPYAYHPTRDGRFFGGTTCNDFSGNVVIGPGGLDLSGLDDFTATVGRVQLGSFGANARPSGTLYLALTNLIVASGTFPPKGGVRTAEFLQAATDNHHLGLVHVPTHVPRRWQRLSRR